MERLAFILLAPPVAVPHYSDATATAAPIAVFWLAGLIGLIHGLTAGSGYSALAGLALYAVAVAWAPAHGIRDLAATPNAFAGGAFEFGLTLRFEPCALGFQRAPSDAGQRRARQGHTQRIQEPHARHASHGSSPFGVKM